MVTDYQVISGEHDFVVRKVQSLILSGYKLRGDIQISSVLGSMGIVVSVFAQVLVKYDPLDE